MSPTLASASAQYDVAVIGAGVAGLAAATMLRRAGLSVIVLEAGRRSGGRAWTDHPRQFGGATLFDHGASWLHDAANNPLVPLARACGAGIGPDTPWDDRVRLYGAPGQRASLQAYEESAARWRDTVTAALDGPDRSLAAAGDRCAGDPWTATIEFWEGAIIAAADADVLSLRDWHANALEGENFIAAEGIGGLLTRCLATEVVLATRVTQLSAEPGGVCVGTADGQSFFAGAAIVTVSTGVLRAEAIGFAPQLPADILSALEGLPMGLLSKIAVPAAGEDRLGLDPGTDIFRQVQARGAPCLPTIFWPQHSNIAIGFVGGRAAWELVAKPNNAADFFLSELDATLGPAARAAFALQHTLMTSWGSDPLFHGAYAYATPGNAGARAMMTIPLWDNRLHFAGEACNTDGLAGTVGGAYLAGREAAQKILRGFTSGRNSV